MNVIIDTTKKISDVTYAYLLLSTRCIKKRTYKINDIIV